MKRFLLIIIFILFFYSSSEVLASSISLYGPKEVNLTESFRVRISLDSDNIPINSIDIVVEFNSDLVDFAGFKDNETLVKTWIVSPKVDDNKVYMTGIIPGGAGGVYDPNKKDLQEIPLVDLIFKAKKVGNVDFIFNKSNVLKNDGLGSAIYPTQNQLNIKIKNNTNEIQNNSDKFLINDSILDINPPLYFTISFVPSSDISQTKDMIIFNTFDLESGIKEYRMKKGSDWIVVSSPLIVAKSIFSKNSKIRAYDFSNNFTESSITIAGYVSFKIILYILIFVILSSIFFRKLLK